LGEKKSDETKAKMRTAKLGKKQSAEHTANLVAASVATRIARREKKIKNGTASKFQIKQHLKYLATLK
jgi:hypothetical protein